MELASVEATTDILFLLFVEKYYGHTRYGQTLNFQLANRSGAGNATSKFFSFLSFCK